MGIEAYIKALAPELILLAGACMVLLLGATRSARMTSAATFVVVAGALFAAAWGTQAVAPEVIPGLWINEFSSFARIAALGVGLLLVLVNWHQPLPAERGEYMAMILLSLLGVVLTAAANDWILLFLAVELVSIPTYVLIALSREDIRAPESAVKYFFLGALAAAILALGLVYMYGASGTSTIFTWTQAGVVSNLSFDQVQSPAAAAGLLLVIGGLSFKIAAVPFHAYVADVYEGAAAPVTGLLGFVPKFAGFVALVKVLSACNWAVPDSVVWLLWILAAVTMTTGNVLALMQRNVKRMLAYSSVAHTGYMLVALLVGPVAGIGPLRDGVAALLFYMIVYGVMNLGAFAVLSAFRQNDHEVETLDDLSGLAKRWWGTGTVLFVCVFSLMGMPLTAGFWGKVYVFSSTFSLAPGDPWRTAFIALAVIGVLNSAIGAAYYLRILAAAYMGTAASPHKRVGGSPMTLAMFACAAVVVVVFVLPKQLSERTAQATSVLQETARVEDRRVTTAAPAGDAAPRSAAMPLDR